jgi:CHAT domain-containing protein
VWGVYVTEERLLAAEEEAKLLQKQYKATSIDAETDPVFALLGGTPPADIIHFAVHGKYDPGGAEEGIYMASGPPPIDPIQIEGSDLTGRKPFVFLNACQVGSASALLGDYSGTAQAFLAAGASAVVAPLWSVDDQIAQDIALKFYKEALASAKAAKGKKSAAAETPPVADLLRRARQGLIDDAGAMSATYLAYQFYGHPSLRLSWAPETASGEPSNG